MKGNTEYLNIRCPQCKEGNLIIEEYNSKKNELDFYFDYSDDEVIQQAKDEEEGTDNFLIINCNNEDCDADFEINDENKIIYWGRDLNDYVYVGNDKWEIEDNSEKKHYVKKYFSQISEEHPNISVNEEILSGIPCIANRRIDVSLILQNIAHDGSFEDIQKDHNISREDIEACLRYASNVLLQIYYE